MIKISVGVILHVDRVNIKHVNLPVKNFESNRHLKFGELSAISRSIGGCWLWKVYGIETLSVTTQFIMYLNKCDWRQYLMWFL